MESAEAGKSILLIPEPKKCKLGNGYLPWNKAKFSCDKDGMPSGENLVCVCPDESLKEQQYNLSIGDFGISIFAGSAKGAKLALQTLRQIAMQSDGLGLPYLEISDWPDLSTRGFMLDISRCKVPTMQTLGFLVDMLALFKFNRLELYTEHTFAYKDREIVWAGASPMTPAEYRMLDGLCRAAGIELVANQNSLGHMERWLRYPEFQYLAESKAPFVDPLGTVRKFPTTLYPDETALEFMDGLYANLLPNFTSDKFNVGCDEPWELGMGRSSAEVAEFGKYTVYLKYLLGLNSLCKKYGKKMYFWADVIMKDPTYAAKLDSSASPILWGYDYDTTFDKDCAYLSSLGLNYLVAPGSNTWNSFGIRLETAAKNIAEAAEAAKKHGAEGLMLTNWGDGGNHQPYCAMYPALLCAASASWCGQTRLEPKKLAEGMSKLMFRDATGKLAAAIMEMGRIDPAKNLRSYHHRLFFAEDSEIDSLRSDANSIALDYMEQTWAAAMRELSQCAPKSPDGKICIAEVKLGLDMTAFAINRAKNDPHTKTSNARRNLKLIAAEFANVWLARARYGGLEEALCRIQNVKPELFVHQYNV